MITRRTFISILGALPFIGKAVAEESVQPAPVRLLENIDVHSIAVSPGGTWGNARLLTQEEVTRIMRKAADPENEEALRKLGIALSRNIT